MDSGFLANGDFYRFADLFDFVGCLFGFNFILEEGKITLNSGVIVKRSKAIAFDKVQNVESVSGILRRMLDYLRSKFGLHRLRR